MTDPTYAASMLLVDRSGSMYSIQESAQDGVNEFIRAQGAADGTRTVRIAQFDSEYDTVHESRPAELCPEFTLAPRGSTALLDAMARAIREFGEELAAMGENERPSTVIFAVMTDGRENSSQEFTYEQVSHMVKTQENVYKWHVLYLGANQDAIAEGARLGVQPSRSLTYAASDAGTRSAYSSVNQYTVAATTGGAATFTEEQRKRASQ